MVAPNSGDLVPGTTFGSYVVHELIARGGMAAVYRAEHLLLHKPVALKVMNRVLSWSQAARQRFLLEGRAAAAIKHPNVVDITDVGVQDGMPYLVMELLEGEDLETYLNNKGVLDDGTTIRLALPIISALNAAHASGVVHRDIKPSNIFLSLGPDEQFVPKVLDFGISKLALDPSSQELLTTPQNEIIGTPYYMPPEALHGTRELGPASDQYSLGVVLYRCVTGSLPFSGDTLVSLLNSLSRGTFEPPRRRQPQISPELDRVIVRALSAEPNERFPTIRDMGRALLELAADRTQTIWGQSFRTPSTGAYSGHLPAPSLRALPTTERLVSEPPAPARRWRSIGVGMSLVLVGALASALWLSLGAREAPLAAQPVKPAAAAPLPAPAPAPVPEAPVSPDTTGVRPVPPESPTATARLPARPRPAASPVPRASSATQRRRGVAPGNAPNAARAAGSGVAASAAPAAPPAKDTPSTGPGANGSLLLD